MRRTIRSFVESLVVDPVLTNPWCDLRMATCEVLEWLFYHPIRAEAEVWSTFPYEDDQCGFGIIRMTSPYTWAAAGVRRLDR